MRRAGWTIATAACMLTAVARPGAAQQPAAAPARTTLAGVYTEEQASLGKDIYLGACRSCHTPASHTGATFAKWWEGRLLADLVLYVREKMPKNNPGSLSPDEYAQVVAYLLKLNGMPAGEEELPTDSATLAKIRIDVKKP